MPKAPTTVLWNAREKRNRFKTFNCSVVFQKKFVPFRLSLWNRAVCLFYFNSTPWSPLLGMFALVWAVLNSKIQRQWLTIFVVMSICKWSKNSNPKVERHLPIPLVSLSTLNAVERIDWASQKLFTAKYTFHPAVSYPLKALNAEKRKVLR